MAFARERLGDERGQERRAGAGFRARCS